MKNLFIPLLISLTFFSISNTIYAQNIDTDNSDLKAWIDTQFAEGLEAFNIPGATFILMQGDSILHSNGYGIANIETKTPVNHETSIFGIASISKTFVATAIMQLVEDGKVQLDHDINTYLKTFQIEYKYGEPITIKHLLTHTAGFDERNIGISVRSEKDVIPLAQFLKTSMPPQIRPPGEALTYSNYVYNLLGLIVEEVSGLSFDEYVQEMILKPLEMNNSGFKRQDNLRENYVASYLQKDSQLIPYKPDFGLGYPCGGFSSTASDMGHYISMYLNFGNFNGTQILDSTTVVQMQKTAFKHYEKAENGWLLGFYDYNWKGLHVVTHAGGIQGFASELILIPDKNIGLFLCVNASSITHTESRRFISGFLNKLLPKLLPDVLNKEQIFKSIPKMGVVEEPLTTFSGTYRYTRYARSTIDKLAVLIGFAPELEIVSKGDTLEAVEFNAKLIPISNLTFYSTTYHTYMAFGRNKKGEIAYFFPDGTQSYQKLKWYEPVKFQLYWIGSIVLILLIAIITSGIRRIFRGGKKSHLIKKVNFTIAFLILVFLSLIAFVLIKTNPQEFFYGLPLLIKILLVFPFIIILLEFFGIGLLIKSWRSRELGTFDLIYQTVIIVAGMAFIPWLMYWNLIGFNY